MLAARKELSDFYATKRIEELTADAYKRGLTDGREQVENEKQDRVENCLIGAFLFGCAAGGSIVFFWCLRGF